MTKSNISILQEEKEERIIFLPKVAFDSRLHESIFTNISTYPTKIELDVKYAIERHRDYIDEIASKLNMDAKTLKNILDTFDRDAKGGIFRISIPIVRLKRGCYCAKIYPEKKHFMKGILMFNGSYGQFPIELTNPEHRRKAERFYELFLDMLDRIKWDKESQISNCPKYNKQLSVNNFCKICIKCDQKYSGGEAL